MASTRRLIPRRAIARETERGTELQCSSRGGITSHKPDDGLRAGQSDDRQPHTEDGGDNSARAQQLCGGGSEPTNRDEVGGDKQKQCDRQHDGGPVAAQRDLAPRWAEVAQQYREEVQHNSTGQSGHADGKRISHPSPSFASVSNSRASTLGMTQKSTPTSTPWRTLVSVPREPGWRAREKTQ